MIKNSSIQIIILILWFSILVIIGSWTYATINIHEVHCSEQETYYIEPMLNLKHYADMGIKRFCIIHVNTTLGCINITSLRGDRK